jgi:predicted transcriptional regulator of viral defense system
MQTLTQELVRHGLANRLFTEAELRWLLKGSAQRRHHLVNRAMKAGELLRLRRGHYLVSSDYRDYPPHPFSLAQAFVPGSYVSFETALAHHGWIPEAVRVTASVTPRRKSVATEHPVFGSFSFHPLAIQQGYFLEQVERLHIEQQSMLVAKPFRALMDLVCLRKADWQGIDWLVEGFRIDSDTVRGITRTDIHALDGVYKQKRVENFLQSLAAELNHD